jgi:integrase
MFRWGVENEIVPPSVLHGLQAVAGLRRGKSDARETAPVRPVADAVVDALRPFVSRQVWVMVELQRLTGMRPGEVVRMRTGEIDRSGEMPVYRPGRHKTQHHGHTRAVYLGQRCQEIVAPFLKNDPEAFIFSPADAEEERRAKLNAARKTPASCGNKPGTNRRRSPKREPGSRYTVTAYLRAIYAGCDQAFPPPADLARRRVAASGRKSRSTRWETRAEWEARLGKDAWASLVQWEQDHRFHPNQLRHSAATRMRRTHSLDHIQAVLGHRNLSTTQIYAELDAAKAIEVMSEAG